MSRTRTIVKRDVVVEHRITTQSLFGWRVRYWIEADPEHGGLTFGEAKAKVRIAERDVRAYGYNVPVLHPSTLALRLAELIPGLNSVEVDNGEVGACVHKDWP